MMIRKQNISNCPLIDVDTGFKNGDIVSKNGRFYYIYSIGKDESVLYGLLEQKSAVSVKYRGEIRYINPGIPKKVSNFNGYEVTGYLPKSTKIRIDKYLNSK